MLNSSFQTIPAVPIGLKKAQENVAGSMGETTGAHGQIIESVKEQTPPPKLGKPKKKFPFQYLIAGVVLLLLLVGSGVGFFLSGQQQDTRQKAAGANIAQLNAEVTALEAELRGAEGRVKERENAKNAAEAALAAPNKEKSALESQLTEAKKQYVAAQDALKKATNSQTIAAVSSAQSKVNDLNNKITALENSTKNLQLNLESATREYNKAVDEKNQIIIRLNNKKDERSKAIAATTGSQDSPAVGTIVTPPAKSCTSSQGSISNGLRNPANSVQVCREGIWKDEPLPCSFGGRTFADGLRNPENTSQVCRNGVWKTEAITCSTNFLGVVQNIADGQRDPANNIRICRSGAWKEEPIVAATCSTFYATKQQDIANGLRDPANNNRICRNGVWKEEPITTTGGGSTTVASACVGTVCTSPAGGCIAVHHCDTLSNNECTVLTPDVRTGVVNAQTEADTTCKCVQVDVLNGKNNSCTNGHINGDPSTLIGYSVVCPSAGASCKTSTQIVVAPTPTPTPTPTTPPTTPPVPANCNDKCKVSTDCANAAHVCYDFATDGNPDGGLCRLTTNPASESCAEPPVVPPPVVPVGCNETCATNSDCKDSNHSCYQTSKTCRLTTNLTSETCSAPPAPPAPGCNQTCYASSECNFSGAVCYDNLCRLSSNPTATNCQAPTTTTAGTYYQQPALPAALPQSGSEDVLNWLKVGLGALGVGLIFLFL